MPDEPMGQPMAAPGGDVSLEGMNCKALLMLAGNALALASQRCVDEYAGQGDVAARIQQLTEEAAGATAQALQEAEKIAMEAAPEGGAAPAAPAPPEAPAGA